MSFFDPPHEKIIGWSPPYFQSPARLLVPQLDATIAELGVPLSGQKLFRTAIIGRLALLSAEEAPGDWSPTALQLVKAYTQNADRSIPSGFRHLLPIATEMLLSAFGRAVEAAHQNSGYG
ncbi:hypothetical protein [Phenylobacterium sp. NIBR 498073]|jgi:hypothetical protein|uniref:hypothetical protein n=1 Tax=Phenylobacterium sp. NIBR 498073 TaxID=3015177 RepID=UPI0022B54930|nr:hypothetical protein [Phenylobacterium sp. NIBR 498073]WGU40339.1 hypothetical protein O4N75_01080 [Phenylobacterium sp. NIBR 498073]